MTKKDYFYIGLITILITGYVIQDIMDVDKTPNPKILYRYIPQEVNINKPYSEVYDKEFKATKPKGEKTTPPKLTKNFKPEDNTIKIRKDSSKFILVDTVTNVEYKVDKEFISLFPYNDKLINFNLSKDTLSIVTLNSGGNITDKTYPLYFDNYNYRFYDNELHHYPNNSKQRTNLKNKYNQLYINSGYNFINQTPNVSLDYLINLGRFRIMAGSDLELRTGNLNVNTKLGYRIF